MSKYTASNFRAMRGDVDCGNEILFPSGAILTITNTLKGWELVDDKGKKIAGPFAGAADLEAWVARNETSVGANGI